MRRKKSPVSVLEKGFTLEGRVVFNGKLVVRGDVKGTLFGETVVVEAGARVHAEIRAGTVTIGGRFAGKIRAMHGLVILPTGVCEGRVLCRDLEVKPGGVLNAEVSRIVRQDYDPRVIYRFEDDIFDDDPEADFEEEEAEEDFEEEKAEEDTDQFEAEMNAEWDDGEPDDGDPDDDSYESGSSGRFGFFK